MFYILTVLVPIGDFILIYSNELDTLYRHIDGLQKQNETLRLEHTRLPNDRILNRLLNNQNIGSTSGLALEVVKR